MISGSGFRGESVDWEVTSYNIKKLCTLRFGRGLKEQEKQLTLDKGATQQEAADAGNGPCDDLSACKEASALHRHRRLDCKTEENVMLKNRLKLKAIWKSKT